MAMRVEKPELVNALAVLLSDSVVLKYIFQGAHWNVVGKDFGEYHKFFGMLYEDVDDAIDVIAEDIRKLGAPAPSRLDDFLRLTNIPATRVGQSCMELMNDSFMANEVIIADINITFSLAEAMNEQGIADDIAARDSMHKKWRWMMKSYMTMESGN
jgi:starvation-inducible DNA-binding protein